MIDNKIFKQLNNNEITKLDLYKNEIENIDKLDESLKINFSLIELNLYGNKIENIYNLCEGLKFNSFLTELYLKYNSFFIDKNNIIIY